MPDSIVPHKSASQWRQAYHIALTRRAGLTHTSVWPLPNPRTNSPASTPRPSAILMMLCSDKFRCPRSTWPMYVQCRSQRSASASWLRLRSCLARRTRSPNARVTGDRGGFGAGFGTLQSQSPKDFQSRDDTSYDDVSCQDDEGEEVIMGGC